MQNYSNNEKHYQCIVDKKMSNDKLPTVINLLGLVLSVTSTKADLQTGWLLILYTGLLVIWPILFKEL